VSVSGSSIVGVVDVVVGAAGVDEFDGGSRGFSLDDLNDTCSGAAGLLDIEDLGLLTVDNALNLSGSRLVVDDSDVVLFTRNSDLGDLGSSLGCFVDTDDLVAGLNILNSDGLTSRGGVDFVALHGNRCSGSGGIAVRRSSGGIAVGSGGGSVAV
jgi:hypothetical protein